MTEHITAKLPKWPFLVGDLALLGLASFIVIRSDWPLGLWQIAFCFVATALGAWLCVFPFLKEYHAASKLAESNALSTALAQIRNLEQIQNSIANATGNWMSVHDHSEKTIAAANEISKQITTEALAFRQFLEKANQSEKAHLRLEVEKLRRSEGEWLQVLVRVLDHVYALNQAGARSGQPALISQLIQFQHACRDAARRVGLVPVGANPYDTFDPNAHQLASAQESLPPKAQVTEVFAVGYSYQGTLIRKPVVSVSPEPQTEFELSVDSAEELSHGDLEEAAEPLDTQNAETAS